MLLTLFPMNSSAPGKSPSPSLSLSFSLRHSPFILRQLSNWVRLISLFNFQLSFTTSLTRAFSHHSHSVRLPFTTSVSQEGVCNWSVKMYYFNWPLTSTPFYLTPLVPVSACHHHLSMAMFPQFFTHPSLYPHFFRASQGATAAGIPNLSLSSQLAILSGSTFPPNGFNSSHAAAALQFANSHNSQFFVDNLIRDRAVAAAAAAAAVAAANNGSPSLENNNAGNSGGSGSADPLSISTSGGQRNSYSPNTPEPNRGDHSPCEHHFGHLCSPKLPLNCCSSEQLCGRQHHQHNHHTHQHQQSGRSSANASEEATTDHETESSQCCDRHSESSSPVLRSQSPPKVAVTLPLKFGVNAILSDSKECKSPKAPFKGKSFLCMSLAYQSQRVN